MGDRYLDFKNGKGIGLKSTNCDQQHGMYTELFVVAYFKVLCQHMTKWAV